MTLPVNGNSYFIGSYYVPSYPATGECTGSPTKLMIEDFCDVQHNYANFAAIPNRAFSCSASASSLISLGKVFKFYGFSWEDCITNASIDISVIDVDTGLEIPSSHIILYQDWRLRFFRSVNYNYNVKIKLEHTDTTYGNNFELISPTFSA